MQGSIARNTQIDSLKFFLIFLVLVGHCIDINLSSRINGSLFRFIYSFHMPVFVIISGMMFRNKNLKELLVGWGGNLLIITYLVFHLLYGGKPLEYNGGSLLDFWSSGFVYNLAHLYDPADGLWYLVSLYFWRLFLNQTPKNLKEKKLLHLGIVLTLSLLMGFVPLGREMSFQRTFAFYPLFVLGSYLRDYYERLRNIPKVIPITAIVIYAALIFATSLPPISVLLERTAYNTSSVLLGVLARGAFYVWVIPISLSVIAVFPDIKYFSQEGKQTMFYYMYHMFFVLLFRYIVINKGLECNILTVLAYATLSFAAMRLLRNVPLLVLLTNPSKVFSRSKI